MSITLLLGGCSLFQNTRFGYEPQGEDLKRIQSSPNYSNDEFHNQIPTSVLKEGESKLSIIISNITSSAQNLRPDGTIPHARKVDLKALNVNQDVLIWLGHSSFFVQIAGKRILIDPVLSTYASPVSFAIPAFKGSTIYSASDIPEIDLLLITHDHWDHLDYDTVKALQAKINKVIVPLGVGSYFKGWGYSAKKINELDWYEQLNLNDSLAVYLIPARHYSGRGLTSNKTLWGGFILESNERRILFGGDSGYDSHFKELGEKFGHFDLVALDMGQYDPRWPYIHMTPKEAAQAAIDLNTDILLPAHVGRFTLAQHDWREPFEQITVESKNKPYQVITPLISETIDFNSIKENYLPWWNI